MKVHVSPIRLNPAVPAPSEGSLVKRGALGLFRLVRAAAAHGREVPGIVQQAVADVREAWQESAGPKPPLA